MDQLRAAIELVIAEGLGSDAEGIERKHLGLPAVALEAERALKEIPGVQVERVGAPCPLAAQYRGQAGEPTYLGKLAGRAEPATGISGADQRAPRKELRMGIGAVQEHQLDTTVEPGRRGW